METLVISRDANLKQRENTLHVSIGGKVTVFPVEKIRHLILLGEGTLTTKLLNLCGRHGVRLSIFDYYGYCKGCFEPMESNPSGMVKLAQAKLLLNDDDRMCLAREVVRGAGYNMRANLLYYRYRGLEEVGPAIREIKHIENRLYTCIDTASLMGMEGNMHQFYYGAWRHVDPALALGRRVRRPPDTPINCLLSFLNQMTYTVVKHEIAKTHLEQTFSFLHAPSSGRASLSLDLAEPFKPVLVDGLIFRIARKGSIKENWFTQHDSVCLLNETGRRHISEQFIRRLEKKWQGRSYREWIYREAINLERHMLGVAEYQSFQRRA